jgi:hypothetical protein
VRVLLADDHAWSGVDLRGLLEAPAGLTVIAEASADLRRSGSARSISPSAGEQQTIPRRADESNGAKPASIRSAEPAEPTGPRADNEHGAGREQR